jgi:hypothetical protein
MTRIYRLGFSNVESDEDQEAANRQTASLAGLAVVLCLVVSSLFVIHRLHAKGAVEDCLMAGRINCDALVASAH